jgi:hypothetical protein
VQLNPVSQTELQTIEGGMIRLRDEELTPVPEYNNGMGYTGIMIKYTLTVIE